MSISKYQINRIQKLFEAEKTKREPQYEFCAIQYPNKPYVIDEIINEEAVRRFSSESEEGKRLIKEGKVKYPKVPILILDL